jgi:8-amino-7-oxononanoate synthase
MSEPEPLDHVGRSYVRYRGRKLSYFSGCDYFRLASHPRVLAALRRGTERFGLNVAASRLTTGNHRLYRELESDLERFFKAETATLVPTGYTASLATTQALAGSFSHALIDERAHFCLTDAAAMLDCPVLRFAHSCPEAVGQLTRRCGPGAHLILLTDGLFAHNGKAAPLAEYMKVLPKDAVLLVDDAHGAGVLGATGKGCPEHAGLDRQRIIQTITLSKAFGVYGGAILGAKPLRKRVWERSRLFIGSTPLPLPLAWAAREAVEVLRTDPSLRRRLTRNWTHLISTLQSASYPAPLTPGPILPLIPKTDRLARKFHHALLSSDIYPPFVRYASKSAGYFRFVISSEHSRTQLDALASVILDLAARGGAFRAPAA